MFLLVSFMMSFGVIGMMMLRLMELSSIVIRMKVSVVWCCGWWLVLFLVKCCFFVFCVDGV